MKQPVLILDYSVDRKSGGMISRWFSCPVTVLEISDGSPFPSLDPESFSGVIHSGSALSITEQSSFTSDACGFVCTCTTAGVPQMGICYGHQLLAKALVGDAAVGRAVSLEAGWLPVDFLPAWPSRDLEGSMRVWQSHYDQVTELPRGSEITATNHHTEIQAFLNRELKLMGTQFHPEFDRETGNACFSEDPDLFRKNGIDLDRVLRGGPDLNTGEVIFGHFMETFGLEK